MKAECKHLGGLLQLISILEWKWEVISMDFIIDLPRAVRQHDSIMVVVKRLSMVAHLILVKTTYLASEVAQVFIGDIVRLHGVPKNIVSKKDVMFTSKFCKDFFAGLGIELAFSCTYHTQKYGHAKTVNRIMEDLMRMYVMHQQRKWEEYLPLVEFPYNNGYQESLRMSTFEALYGGSCNTPISWSDPVNMVLIGSDMLADMEQEMQVINKNIKAA